MIANPKPKSERTISRTRNLHLNRGSFCFIRQKIPNGDLEGCHFQPKTWNAMVRLLQTSVAPTLQRFTCSISGSNATHADVMVLMEHGVRHMCCLEVLHVMMTAIDLWDAKCDELLLTLPASLRLLHLDMGSVHSFTSTNLRFLSNLEILVLQVPEGDIYRLELPPRLQRFSLDICEGTMHTSLYIPSTVFKITLFAVQGNLPENVLRVGQCRHLEDIESAVFT